MMALIIVLLLLAVLSAWSGIRRTAMLLFAITMVLSVAWFGHHMTSHLLLQL